MFPRSKDFDIDSCGMYKRAKLNLEITYNLPQSLKELAKLFVGPIHLLEVAESRLLSGIKALAITDGEAIIWRNSSWKMLAVPFDLEHWLRFVLVGTVDLTIFNGNVSLNQLRLLWTREPQSREDFHRILSMYKISVEEIEQFVLFCKRDILMSSFSEEMQKTIELLVLDVELKHGIEVAIKVGEILTHRRFPEKIVYNDLMEIKRLNLEYCICFSYSEYKTLSTEEIAYKILEKSVPKFLAYCLSKKICRKSTLKKFCMDHLKEDWDYIEEVAVEFRDDPEYCRFRIGRIAAKYNIEHDGNIENIWGFAEKLSRYSLIDTIEVCELCPKLGAFNAFLMHFSLATIEEYENIINSRLIDSFLYAAKIATISALDMSDYSRARRYFDIATHFMKKFNVFIEVPQLLILCRLHDEFQLNWTPSDLENWKVYIRKHLDGPEFDNYFASIIQVNPLTVLEIKMRFLFVSDVSVLEYLNQWNIKVKTCSVQCIRETIFTIYEREFSITFENVKVLKTACNNADRSAATDEERVEMLDYYSFLDLVYYFLEFWVENSTLKESSISFLKIFYKIIAKRHFEIKPPKLDDFFRIGQNLFDLIAPHSHLVASEISTAMMMVSAWYDCKVESVTQRFDKMCLDQLTKSNDGRGQFGIMMNLRPSTEDLMSLYSRSCDKHSFLKAAVSYQAETNESYFYNEYVIYKWSHYFKEDFRHISPANFLIIYAPRYFEDCDFDPECIKEIELDFQFSYNKVFLEYIKAALKTRKDALTLIDALKFQDPIDAQLLRTQLYDRLTDCSPYDYDQLEYILDLLLTLDRQKFIERFSILQLLKNFEKVPCDHFNEVEEAINNGWDRYMAKARLNFLKLAVLDLPYFGHFVRIRNVAVAEQILELAHVGIEKVYEFMVTNELEHGTTPAFVESYIATLKGMPKVASLCQMARITNSDLFLVVEENIKGNRDYEWYIIRAKVAHVLNLAANILSASRNTTLADYLRESVLVIDVSDFYRNINTISFYYEKAALEIASLTTINKYKVYEAMEMHRI